MRRRLLTVVIGIASLALLVGCASTADAGAHPLPTSGASSTPTNAPASSPAAASAAELQAQEWLDAAVVPPDAEPTAESPVGFGSYQGWPCQPVAELEGYWMIPDTTVEEVVNWLRVNPTANLVSTAVGPPLAEGSGVDQAMVGYIPADESQQGIVFTAARMKSGVALRAEVAALTESAVCPSLGPNVILGKPGQG